MILEVTTPITDGATISATAGNVSTAWALVYAKWDDLYSPRARHVIVHELDHEQTTTDAGVLYSSAYVEILVEPLPKD